MTGLPEHLIPLTENGIKQSQAAGQKIEDHVSVHDYDYKDYEIYVSPYARAKATLHAMNHKSEGNGRRSSARDGLWKAKCSVY